MEIKDRLKILRAELDLSQTKFADSISRSQNAVAQAEIGSRNPSNNTIAEICRVHNVNEDWLRTGEGEMFKPKNTDLELAPLLGALLNKDTKHPEFKKRLIINMLEMDDSQWNVVEDFVMSLAETIKKETSE